MPAQGGTVRWIIEADDSQFNQTIDNVSKKANELSSNLGKTGSSNFWSNIIGDTRGVSSAFQQIGSSLKSIGWGVFQAGATGATGALGSLIAKGIQATDFLETSRTAMSGLIGSISEGNKAMSIAANYWQNNPFQRIDVTNATKQLVQFGRTTGQIGGDLKILGDISLSTGAGIDELARYYARVSASGRAMTMDLEMMSDRGIPIYRELQKQLKTTQQGVRDMASAGKIDFETFRKAMEGAVNPEAMKQFEETLARQRDRFKGSIQILAGDLAGYKIINNELVISEQGLEKAYTRLLKTLSTGLRSEKMREAMEKIGKAIAQVIDKITELIPLVTDGLSKALSFIADNSAVLIPILGVALALLGKIGSNIPGIGGVLGAVTGNLKGLKSGFLALNPVLQAFLVVFGIGFASAVKNSETFRASLRKIFDSIGTLVGKIIPIIQTFVSIFVQIASSDAVIGFLELAAQALAWLAEAISKIPIEMLTALITTLLTFKLLDANPIMGYTAVILGLVAVLKQIGPDIINSLNSALSAIGNWFKNIGKGFSNAAKDLAVAGHNLMVGLQNGINEGAKKVLSFVASIATGIVNTFKSMMGIHSPSTVMAEQGKYVTLGLAQGITDSKSAVQKAMDNLATDIFNALDKVIGNKADFGLLDYRGQYQEWKKISKMFTVGSSQYQNAIEKMEQARKQANLQILSLQKSYNDALDDTISKISTAYGLFDTVDTSGGKDSQSIISDLDQQVAALQNFASTKEIIGGLQLDRGLIDELQNMGVDASQELATIAQMTSSELGQLNDLWVQKQQVSNRAAVAQMSNLKTDTLQQVADIKNGIDGETVSLVDTGGRLVENISEGVYGAMPTLENAFSQMGTYIANAQRELASGKAGAGGAFNPADLAPDVSDNITKALDEAGNQIKGNAEELGKKIMGYVGIGLVGGVALKLLMGKLIPFLGQKVLGSLSGGALMGVLGNMTGAGKVAGQMGQAATQTGTMATSATQIGSNTQVMGAGMSKASSVMGLIIKGALAVVAIAGAIAAMAAALSFAYHALEGVNLGELLGQMGVMLAVLSLTAVIMGVIGKFAAFVALGAVVSAVVSGALLLCAMALAEVTKLIPQIDKAEIIKLAAVIAVVDIILGLVAGLATLGAIGAIANTIIAGGLVLTARGLVTASQMSKLIDVDNLRKLEGAMVEVDIILGLLSGLAALGAIGATIQKVIVQGVSYAARELLVASVIARQLDDSAMNKLQWMLEKIASWKTGNLWDNLTNMINSDLLMNIARNVRSVVEALNGIEPLETNVVDGLKQNMENLSQIKIQGSGFFENKGAAAEELVGVMRNLAEISRILAGIGAVDYNMVASFVDSIKLFDRIDDKAKDGIRRLKDLGDSTTNIDKIKAIFGYMPEGIWDKALAFINAIKLFDRIDDNARNGALRLRSMGDSLSNIDWIKHILGDIPEDLPVRSGYLVEAIRKLSAIQLNEEEIANALLSVAGLIDAIHNTITASYARIREAGNNLAQNLADGMNDRAEAFDLAGRNIVVHFVAGIASQHGNLTQAGQDIQGKVWDAIEARLKDEYWQGAELANQLRQGIASVSMEEAGRNAIKGFIDGANSKDTRSVGWNIADRFLKGLKERGQQGSPWKTTFESGVWAGEGLANGIAASENLVVGQAYNLADQVIEALSMDDVSMSPNFTPSVGGQGLPLMDMEGGYVGNGRAVEINQTNNNYTNYSMQKLNSDLRWELSKI